MDKPLKICLVSTQVYKVPPEGYGGLEGVVFDLGVELLKLGHIVSVVCPTGSSVPGAEMIMPCDPNLSNPEGVAYEAYKERLDEMDICHDHSWACFPYLWKMQQNPDLKIIHTVHAMCPYGSPPPVEHPNFVGLSKHHAQLISSRLGIRIDYCYNGVDLDNYTLCEKKEDYLLFVGRISVYKGPHEFIALCRRLGIKGIVVGEDILVEDQKYVRQVMDACDGRNVIYYGRVPRGSDLMVELMQHARAVVMPLLPDYWEGFGLYMVEAMACGTPCVVTDRGAPSEIIANGKSGFVVPTVFELDQAVKNLDGITPQACRKQAEKFSRRAMAEAYLVKYRQILDGNGW